MPIYPNAAPDEPDSPYFLANENICRSFDEFIRDHGGETLGNYNAFSYNVLGKIRHKNKWEFRIKKSSFTSGNLLLSSKHQSLYVASIWTAQHIQTDCLKFHIRPKKIWDFVMLGISKNWHYLTDEKKYTIKSQNPNHDLINDLKIKLIDLFNEKKVWEIQYKNSVLKIELRSESTHTDIIEKLLAEKFD